MTLALAVAIGVLYAGGIYMMLRRSIAKLVIGLALLSHGANLLIFTVTGLRRQQDPILPKHGPLDAQSIADPLPHAIILTAIVISFGVLSFVITLLHRASEEAGTDDLDRIRVPEQ